MGVKPVIHFQRLANTQTRRMQDVVKSFQCIGAVMSYLAPTDIDSFSSVCKSAAGKSHSRVVAANQPWHRLFLHLAASTTSLLWALNDCIVTGRRLKALNGIGTAARDVVCAGLSNGVAPARGIAILGPARDVRLCMWPTFSVSQGMHLLRSDGGTTASLIRFVDTTHVAFANRCALFSEIALNHAFHFNEHKCPVDEMSCRDCVS